MRKYFLTIGFLICASGVFAQAGKYFTRDGVIKFTSEAPVEKIESSNKEVNIIIDPAASMIAFKVVMKSFGFVKQGMKDHFNDTYLETDQFPNATFEGKIISKVDWAYNATYNATVEGTLTIHGVSKPVKQTGKITVEAGKISLSSSFNILLTDYKIKVPTNYVSKISNTINIQINGTLTPYTR